MASPILNSRSPRIELITSHIDTPVTDDRSYRVIRLSNQLEVLLVHDAETDKASAAMDVNVGAFSDLEDMPGIAHAVEHVLFMGTKKYPTENDYSSYLSANSGYSNAFTSSTSTNYYFEVAAKSSEDSGKSLEESSPFYGALDRFAQFFIEPLFLADTVDRELRAVDSENKKNLQSDPWRFNQLNKALSNPKHPYCHFSTGSLETLKHLPEARGVNVRQEFMNFHARHYSANRMKLVILGSESLDVLESWASDLFGAVPDKNLEPNRWTEEVPLRPEDLCTQYFVKPVTEDRSITLFFPCPDESELFASKPSRYVSHLIGHEGPGSLMAYLKSKGWVNGLSSYGSSVCPGSPMLFSCEMRLTEQGLMQYKEIIKIFFQYVSLLKENPPQEWIFEEQKGLASLEFKFKQKSPPSSFASKTSGDMHKPIPREWLLSNSILTREFNPQGITNVIDCLRPDNFRICVVSQTFPGDWDQREKWYDTEYKYEKMPQDFLDEVRAAGQTTAAQRIPELHLPHKNQFIAEKFDVEKKEVAKPLLAPKLIRNDATARIWYKKDDTYWVPKVNVVVDCRTSVANSVANQVLINVYCELVKDALEEYAYDAELAGLGYSITGSRPGVNFQVTGYNDKLSILLETVLTTMRDLVVAEDRFAIVHERLSRSWRNWGFNQPYYQVGELVRWLSSDQGSSIEGLLVELEHITRQDVQEFVPVLLKQMHFEVLIHGNVYKEDALRYTKLIETTLKPRVLPKFQWRINRSLIVPQGGNFRYSKTLKDPKNVNHCIQYLLGVGDRGDRLVKCRLALIEQLTHEPCFDQLRSKEQLGYVVFSGAYVHHVRMSYFVLIQSERNCEYLETRIESFLTGYATTLADMSDSEFEGHKRALINKKLEKMKNMQQESSRLWGYIEAEYFDFDSVNLDVEVIKTLTKPDMVAFFAEFINPASTKRAKFAVHLNALGVSEAVAPAAGSETVVLESVEQGSAANGGTATDTGLVAAATIAVENGIKALGLGKAEESKADDKNESVEVVNIDDVREFKASLQVARGATPIKDISEYYDVDVKL